MPLRPAKTDGFCRTFPRNNETILSAFCLDLLRRGLSGYSFESISNGELRMLCTFCHIILGGALASWQLQRKAMNSCSWGPGKSRYFSGFSNSRFGPTVLLRVHFQKLIYLLFGIFRVWVKIRVLSGIQIKPQKHSLSLSLFLSFY